MRRLLVFLGFGQIRCTTFSVRVIVFFELYWEPSGREIVIPHLKDTIFNQLKLRNYEKVGGRRRGEEKDGIVEMCLYAHCRVQSIFWSRLKSTLFINH